MPRKSPEGRLGRSFIGGVANMGIRLLSAIRQAVLRRSTGLSTRYLQIEFSHRGADAGVIGSIWLALEHAFEVTG